MDATNNAEAERDPPETPGEDPEVVTPTVLLGLTHLDIPLRIEGQPIDPVDEPDRIDQSRRSGHEEGSQ